MSDKLGWHVLSGEHLLALLKRCAAGEDPDMVFMELYVNARREQVAAVSKYECVKCKAKFNSWSWFVFHTWKCRGIDISKNGGRR